MFNSERKLGEFSTMPNEFAYHPLFKSHISLWQHPFAMQNQSKNACTLLSRLEHKHISNQKLYNFLNQLFLEIQNNQFYCVAFVRKDQKAINVLGALPCFFPSSLFNLRRCHLMNWYIIDFSYHLTNHALSPSVLARSFACVCRMGKFPYRKFFCYDDVLLFVCGFLPPVFEFVMNFVCQKQIESNFWLSLSPSFSTWVCVYECECLWCSNNRRNKTIKL